MKTADRQAKQFNRFKLLRHCINGPTIALSVGMTPRTIHLLIAAVALSGCLADSAGQVSGEHHQYIVSEFRVPANATEARQAALDLDGDKRVDNRLGQVLLLLASNGFDIQPTLTTALQRGDILLGLDVQTPNFADAANAGVQIVTGFDTAPSACNNATPATCGQHLRGNALMFANASVPQMYSTGPVADGTMLTRGGILPVRLAVDANNYIELNLHDAAVQLKLAGDTPTGILAGVVPAADVDRVLIPQFGKQFRRIAHEDCPTRLLGRHRDHDHCGCTDDSRGWLLTRLFDRDYNCEITDAEIRSNSLATSLLGSDVTGSDGPGLSFAVAISLAPATFASAP